MQERYPGLSQLLGAYFHQDWDARDASDDAVIARFQREEPGALVQRARDDIAHVLHMTRSDAELSAMLDSLGNYYYFPADGLSAQAWLARVGERLAAAG